MSENPYAPPSARVDDVVPSGAPRVRPPQIMLAIQLAAANYVLGLVVILVTWDYYSRVQSPTSTVIGQVVGLLIAVWFYYKIYQGRNWARIVLLVLTIIGILASLSSIFRAVLAVAPTIVKVQMGLGWVISLAIIYLLFFSPGKTWFQKDNF
jgi:multisubunit Na+/H+ antiporter MnhG subunit